MLARQSQVLVASLVSTLSHTLTPPTVLCVPHPHCLHLPSSVVVVGSRERRVVFVPVCRLFSLTHNDLHLHPHPHPQSHSLNTTWFRPGAGKTTTPAAADCPDRTVFWQPVLPACLPCLEKARVTSGQIPAAHKGRTLTTTQPFPARRLHCSKDLVLWARCWGA